MVYTFTVQEKVNHEKEMASTSPGTVSFCANIERQRLFRAHAKQIKGNVYTKQSIECLNWVFRHAEKTSRCF